MTTKDEVKKTVKKTAAKAATGDKPARKPRATAKSEESEMVPAAAAASETVAMPTLLVKPTIEKGKYVFATGRRKTAVANIRMVEASGENLINRKGLNLYFFHTSEQNAALEPLRLAGLLSDFTFSATVTGGGIKAQAEAVRHGLSRALAAMSDELKTLMKRSGFLTRDSREKERKKPGLKRARRSPQWAKR